MLSAIFAHNAWPAVSLPSSLAGCHIGGKFGMNWAMGAWVYGVHSVVGSVVVAYGCESRGKGGYNGMIQTSDLGLRLLGAMILSED